MNRVFILAGTHEQARILARWHDMAPSEWRSVLDVETMRGMRNQTLWLFGTWRERRDAPECVAFARAAGMKIFTIEDDRYVGDDWK